MTGSLRSTLWLEPTDLLARRAERQAHVGKNHPLGHIRDLPESVKALTRSRPFNR